MSACVLSALNPQKLDQGQESALPERKCPPPPIIFVQDEEELVAGGVKDNRLPAAMFLPQLLLHCGVARKGRLEERLGVRLLLGAMVGSEDTSWQIHDER